MIQKRFYADDSFKDFLINAWKDWILRKTKKEKNK